MGRIPIIPRFSLFLPNIRSAYNVGSFFRTADGLGVDHIFLGGYTACPPHKEISKTALGAEGMVSWSHQKDIRRKLREFKKHGVQIVALELGEEATPLSKFTPKFPLCLVVGNEVEGIATEILNLADCQIYIPMQGQKESFNVMIAGSIALWEIGKHGS